MNKNGWFYRAARSAKNGSPLLQRLYTSLKKTRMQRGSTESAYAARLAAETQTYQDMEDINVLPPIFHYWSNKYLRPMLEEFGVSNPDQFFAKFLRESSDACGDSDPVFLSVGAGNCDTEVRVAKLMRDAGLTRFTIECLDMNPHTLERGRELAQREGVSEQLSFLQGDFNRWVGTRKYAGIIANQSLHHVLELEHLFDEIKRALKPNASFITSDMIGRNGHLRWPEALAAVQRFWAELPSGYRYNRQLERREQMFEDWDCSTEGFEGIRAQDVLPLLIERFHFKLFIAFSNVTDIFIDRSFGHNFNAEQAWDRDFVDRLHAFDEEGIKDGTLTPTHLMAVMTTSPVACQSSRGLTPEKSVRKREIA